MNSSWTFYKNHRGARRSDGLYIRRSWAWYSRWERPVRNLKGWDLNKSLTILGTFPDQPLEQILEKVDLLLPLGHRHPLGPFRYADFDCPSCEATSYIEGLPFREAETVCPHCGETVKFRAWDYVRELELLPEQKLVDFTEERY